MTILSTENLFFSHIMYLQVIILTVLFNATPQAMLLSYSYAEILSTSDNPNVFF